MYFKWECNKGHTHRIDAGGEVYFYRVNLELKNKTYQWYFCPNPGKSDYHSWIVDREVGVVKGFETTIQVSPDNIKDKLKTILTFL